MYPVLKKINNYLILFLFLNFLPLPSQTVNVPLGHWAYNVLERFEMRQALKGVLNNTKPMTRREIAENIARINEFYSSNPDYFTQVELEWIEELNNEFYDDLGGEVPSGNSIDNIKNSFLFRSWWPNVLYENNRNFFEYRYKQFYFNIDPILRYSNFSGNLFGIEGKRSFLSNGFTFRGEIGTVVGYYFDFTDNTFSGNFGIPGGLSIIKNSGWPWVNTHNPEKIMFDENVFYVFLEFPYVDLEFGRDYTKWGPMHSGQLTMSTHSPAMDMFRLNLNVWRFKLTGVTGFLTHVPEGAEWNPKGYPVEKKFVAASRFEIDLGAGVQLALTQQIIYGGRDLEIGYLIPFSFYKSSEHYYADRDNGLLGADIEWNFIRNYKIYGEILFDDLSTTKLGTDFYGNKYAFGVGLAGYNVFWIDDLEARVEYTRIQPYVYTHTFDLNKHKHYDSNLGHWMGPNTDLTHVELSYWFSRKFRVDANWQYWRHGANPSDRNVGGDIDQPFVSGEDNPSVIFLDGILAEKMQYHVTINYEIFRRSIIFLTIGQNRDIPYDNETFWEIGFEINYGQK